MNSRRHTLRDLIPWPLPRMAGGACKRSFATDRRGSTAIEFALLVWPLAVFIFGILEIGLLTFETATMDGATRAAARQVRTGQVQTSSDALQTFTTAFCNAIIDVSCAGYSFDIRTFADFPQIVLPAVTYDKNGVPQNLTFQPGGPGTVVTVRVLHNYQFVTPFIGTLMGAGSNGLPLISTAVMRTEPFPQ